MTGRVAPWDWANVVTTQKRWVDMATDTYTLSISQLTLPPLLCLALCLYQYTHLWPPIVLNRPPLRLLENQQKQLRHLSRDWLFYRKITMDWKNFGGTARTDFRKQKWVPAENRITIREGVTSKQLACWPCYQTRARRVAPLKEESEEAEHLTDIEEGIDSGTSLYVVVAARIEILFRSGVGVPLTFYPRYHKYAITHNQC